MSTLTFPALRSATPADHLDRRLAWHLLRSNWSGQQFGALDFSAWRRGLPERVDYHVYKLFAWLKHRSVIVSIAGHGSHRVYQWEGTSNGN